jgi:hypothetical protein
MAIRGIPSGVGTMTSWFNIRFSVQPPSSLCLLGESVVSERSPKRHRAHKASTKILILCLSAFCALAISSSAQASGDLSAKQLRKLITHLAGIALPSNAVRVTKSSSVDAATIEATAEIETAFRLEQNEKRQWRVAEIRTGQNQWEEIEVIARALKAEVNAGSCDNPDLNATKSETDPSVKRARCLIASLLGVQLPSDAVRIREVSPLAVPLSSRPTALVVATVAADFRFSKAPKASWRVAGVRTGNREWADPDAILTAVNADKAARARAELASIATALQAFHRERGFYVESKSEAELIDHLCPRYLSRVIRVDPWLRPYRYEATRDHFTLRSTGPDGKENTVDDIALTGAAGPVQMAPN